MIEQSKLCFLLVQELNNKGIFLFLVKYFYREKNDFFLNSEPFQEF